MTHCVPLGGGALAGSRGGLLLQHTAAPLLPQPASVARSSARCSQTLPCLGSNRCSRPDSTGRSLNSPLWPTDPAALALCGK